MHNLDNFFKNLIAINADLGSKNNLQFESVVGRGGLFLDESVPASFVSLVSSSKSISVAVSCCRTRGRSRRRGRLIGGGGFLSVTLSSIKDGEEFGAEESVSGGVVGKIEEKSGESENGNESETVAFKDVVNEMKGRLHGGGGTLNTAKHLLAGAVAAMVSRTFVAPLERLKLEYIVRGEQKNLLELVKTIASSQGLRGFWKGNFVNILRIAPFKSINFYAYDTYRNQLLKWSGNEETTNFERLLAGAAAGIAATVLCIPMDT